ncbi:beta-carotene 15,15'-monooxygenase [Bacillaceae bacterium W0354]
MVFKRALPRQIWLVLLLFVLSCNFILYHTAFGLDVIPANPKGVVIGSIIDLAIISPTLFLAWLRKWNWKYIVSAIATGLILVRFLIPMNYLEPFEAITWVGFIAEGMLLMFELAVVVTLFVYIPNITRVVKQSSLPVLFSFHHAVEEKIKSLPIIHAICSEMLVFYYAFASWRKQIQPKSNTFTLHQKSSYIAVHVMLIHAIIIETIGIHWWLHDQYPIASIILLILNIYGVIFLIGDIQAVRLTPILVTDEKLYISLGLIKRMEIEWSNVEKIIDDRNELEKKLSKDTIDFIAKDFDDVTPTVILELKEPTEVMLLMRLRRKYKRVAIRVDEPTRFMKFLNERMDSI